MAKNPDMPKSEAFAIATQQSHALGKTPKSYGTSTGKHVAKEKYDTPRDDKQTANPGKLKSSVMEKAATANWEKVHLVFPSDGSKHNLLVHPDAYKELSGAPSIEAWAKKHHGKIKYAAEWKDKLPGGLSDKKTPDDFDSSSLREGRKVESEHTKDKHLQAEISMDHLTEDPQYYKKLEKMEKSSMKLAAVSFPAGHPGAGLFATSKPAMLPRKPAIMAKSAPVGAAPKGDVSRGALSAGAQIAPQSTAPRPGPLDFSGKTAMVMMAAMADEFAKIALAEKDSGFLGDIASKVKQVAMTDVGGPKGILQSAQTAMQNGAPKGGPSKGFQAFQAANRTAGR